MLENGRRILMDFHHIADTELNNRPEIDLAGALREELKDAGRDYFDVVAFTHGDEDHVKGSGDFFELEHASKYCGQGRIKIRELWVPAAMLVDIASSSAQLCDRVLLRQEARYRLRQGAGIKIFSRPDMLKTWMADNGIDYESRKHLFVDAGQLVDGFSLSADGVEFFVHSPFVKHTDQGDDLRNTCSLIFNVRFSVNGMTTDYLAIGDSDHEVLADIVHITTYHLRMDRLAWDLFNIPHHCSYTALGPDKGKCETIPVEDVKTLLLQGRPGSYLVSSSDPIDQDVESYEQIQPPHIQARNTYEKYLKEVRGRWFLVTMEEPNRAHPKPLVFEITGGGCSWKKSSLGAYAAVTQAPPPRAG
ncbi:MAG: hypothetical protein WD793_02025 [Steroidobacteraceae bacterium]